MLVKRVVTLMLQSALFFLITPLVLAAPPPPAFPIPVLDPANSGFSMIQQAQVLSITPPLVFDLSEPLDSEHLDTAMNAIPEAALPTVSPTIPILQALPVVPTPASPPRNPKIWEGSFELGLNGTTGNADRFTTRFSSKVKRETANNIFKSSLVHAYGMANGIRNENKLLIDARQEWLEPGRPYNYFMYSGAVYDQFRAFDLQLTGGAGLSYDLIKNDQMRLSTRVGAGFSREFGGPENRIAPEATFGVDWDFKISDRQKFTSAIDLFPDLGMAGDFRANAKASWELLIDPTYHLTLELGVLDRYDSTPEGAKRNDLDYFALFGWKF